MRDRMLLIAVRALVVLLLCLALGLATDWLRSDSVVFPSEELPTFEVLAP